jgi:hypothetical protein
MNISPSVLIYLCKYYQNSRHQDKGGGLLSDEIGPLFESSFYLSQLSIRVSGVDYSSLSCISAAHRLHKIRFYSSIIGSLYAVFISNVFCCARNILICIIYQIKEHSFFYRMIYKNLAKYSA